MWNKPAYRRMAKGVSDISIYWCRDLNFPVLPDFTSTGMALSSKRTKKSSSAEAPSLSRTQNNGLLIISLFEAISS